jgi:DNA-binding beta-propeller fold protein YncE
MTSQTLISAGSIFLPGVKGRIDHLAFNNKAGVVYVAALGNNTLEVVDLKKGEVIQSIKGLNEPQGIRYVPETNSIAVANGGNGEIMFFDAESYKLIRSVKLGDDADNVRYDPESKNIYVGYGSGAIAALNAISFEKISEIKLPVHPESFQLLGQGIICVNLPDAHQVDVLDMKQNKIISKWEISEAAANFPMAVDLSGNRLFIGCRRPAKLLVLDSQTGRIISSIDADSDTDDLFYDKDSDHIYMSCGGGYLDIFNNDGNKYERISRVETAPGARTSLFIPELNELVIAAPSRSGNEAKLLIYKKK